MVQVKFTCVEYHNKNHLSGRTFVVSVFTEITTFYDVVYFIKKEIQDDTKSLKSIFVTDLGHLIHNNGRLVTDFGVNHYVFKFIEIEPVDNNIIIYVNTKPVNVDPNNVLSNYRSVLNLNNAHKFYTRTNIIPEDITINEVPLHNGMFIDTYPPVIFNLIRKYNETSENNVYTLNSQEYQIHKGISIVLSCVCKSRMTIKKYGYMILNVMKAIKKIYIKCECGKVKRPVNIIVCHAVFQYRSLTKPQFINLGESQLTTTLVDYTLPKGIKVLPLNQNILEFCMTRHLHCCPLEYLIPGKPSRIISERCLICFLPFWNRSNQFYLEATNNCQHQFHSVCLEIFRENNHKTQAKMDCNNNCPICEGYYIYKTPVLRKE